MGWLAGSKAETTLEAVVIRADGSREELGVISINGRPATRLRKLIHRIKGALKHGSR